MPNSRVDNWRESTRQSGGSVLAQGCGGIRRKDRTSEYSLKAVEGSGGRIERHLISAVLRWAEGGGRERGPGGSASREKGDGSCWSIFYLAEGRGSEIGRRRGEWRGEAEDGRKKDEKDFTDGTSQEL
eukprot:750537-Hanusia_phi.AAC.3